MKAFKAFFEKYSVWFISLGSPGLFLWAFFEAIFFPLPPDIGLILFVKENPEIWINLAALSTVGSASGAMVGWLIGSVFKEKLEIKFAKNNKYQKIKRNLLKYGGEAIVFAGFTPLPYKLFAITSGMIGLPLKVLFWSSIIGRGARFALVGYVTAKFKDGISEFWSSPSGLIWIFVMFLALFIYAKRKSKNKENRLFKPKHLGGHDNKTWLDKGALSYLVTNLKVKSYLDIGCGPGGMIKLAESMDLKAYGIDGDPTLKFNNLDVLKHDYTKGESAFDQAVDLAWSVEFLEHVDERYQEHYMKDFQKAKYVFVTHAPIGKKGHHHVNCQSSEYWIDVFEKYGFKHERKHTENVRIHSTMPREFVKETGLVFSNLN